MAARWPRGWVAARPAGSQYADWTPAARRIPSPGNGRYVIPVTVDLGNDGIAPQVTFGAGGLAQAFTGPSSSGEVWSLDQCSVSTSLGALDNATCIVYNGPQPVPQCQITGSLSGGQSQFGLGGVSVPFGWFIWALWTGGDPGAFGYLRLTGVKATATD
jgi:hypothetical protein